MDFGLRGVALGSWGCGDGRATVGLHGEIEDMLFERCGGAEGGEDEAGFERGGGGEELMGQVFVGLRELLAGHRVFGRRRVCVRTMSSLPLPVSLMLKAKASWRLLFCSLRVRNAWCGLFPLRPSVVVRTILRVSAAERVTAEERGDVGESL